MNNRISVILGIVVIAISTSTVLIQNQNIQTYPLKQTIKQYTITEVLAHSDRSDCWTIINGNVYDVTSWISDHPGGARTILSICGKDGSNAFNDQHGGKENPSNELLNFKIGTVIK